MRLTVSRRELFSVQYISNPNQQINVLSAFSSSSSQAYSGAGFFRSGSSATKCQVSLVSFANHEVHDYDMRKRRRR